MIGIVDIHINNQQTLYYKLHVDGESHAIAYVIEHRDDYKIAEIIEFSVDGKKIDL